MGVFWWCWAVFVFPGMLMRAMAACVIALDALGGLALVLSEAGLKPELDIEVILVGICPNKSRHRSSIAIPLLLFISINTIIHYLSPIKHASCTLLTGLSGDSPRTKCFAHGILQSALENE